MMDTKHLSWYALVITVAVGVWSAGLFAAETPAPGTAAGPAPSAREVVLGISTNDGVDYDTEFQAYSELRKFYVANGVRAALMDAKRIGPMRGALSPDEFNPEALLRDLRKYHVVHVVGRHEGASHCPAWRELGPKVGKALAQYAAEGGGLLFQPAAVRYASNDDEKYWNLLYEPFGMQQLAEGVCDPENQQEFSIKMNLTASFFHTRQIAVHEATRDVTSLWLPKTDYYPNSGVPAMQYSADWTVLVRGEKSARSYRSLFHENILRLDQPGTYETAPPILAVRQFGKGRVACLPVCKIHTWLNYGNPFWPHFVESTGDPATGRGSDMMKLLGGTVKWLGQAALANPRIGTLPPFEYRPVVFPESAEIDTKKLSSAILPAEQAAVGIIGLHSSYSDGQGSVVDYAETAKKEGLSFIVFTDPLELLTREKLAALQRDCAAASGPEFYACPGIEFTDGSGVRWISYGEKIEWPESFKAKNFTYEQWDGKAVPQFGHYRQQCDFYPTAVIDYKQMRQQGASPENMWWFNMLIPYAYERDRLLADNTADIGIALRDLRYFMPITFTRIRTPADVGLAKRTARTVIPDREAVRNLLNRRGAGAAHGAASAARTYVAFGGDVAVRLDAVNSQMEENFRLTRGAQRIRVQFTASSPAGIREVAVHDADYGVFRRFAGEPGQTELTRAFEMVHDRQYWLYLEVTDNRGAKAFSHTLFVRCYKQGLFRCGDNLNILGPLGFSWHPDRCAMLDAAKDFMQGKSLMIQGWDTSEVDLPQPTAKLLETIQLQDIGVYPPKGDRLRMRMRVQLAGHNLQIVDMLIDDRVENFPSAKRAPGAMGSIVVPVEENPYYTRTDRLIAPADRTDWFVAWNHRRARESVKEFDGGFLWHEGEFRFKKDVTLAGALPIPLIQVDTPVVPEKKWGTVFVVKDADRGLLRGEVTEPARLKREAGRIGPGGYAARLNTPLGYLAVLVPPGMDFAYESTPAGVLRLGVGRDGQAVKAGTVLKYAYLVGTFIDGETRDTERLEHVAQAFNLAGTAPGYPVTVTVGKLVDATFFCRVAAVANEARFALGPKEKLGIDLPISVSGLADNGCAAVRSTRRDWFRFVPVFDGTAHFQEPIDEHNEMWVGNVFLATNKQLCITLVADGQAPYRPPFVEVHNPTAEAIAAELYSPPGTPEFGGTRFPVQVPAGASLRIARREWKVGP